MLEAQDNRLLCEVGLDADPRLVVFPAAASPGTPDPRRTGLPAAVPLILGADAEPRITDERRLP